MVLRSLPRCRAIAEIVQPWRRNACTSMSSSRVSMSGGAPLSWCVVRDHQPQGSPACLGGATRVGIFSEQVWGLSHERHQPPYKPFRCTYVARQIAVKGKYDLWVTAAERDAMTRVVATYLTMALPGPGSASVS